MCEAALRVDILQKLPIILFVALNLHSAVRIGALHNGILFVFSLVMWVSVIVSLVIESPWASSVQFFCLPYGKPEMPTTLVALPYLFYISKIYEVSYEYLSIVIMVD